MYEALDNKINDDVLYYIFDKLSWTDIIVLSGVCKKFNNMLNEFIIYNRNMFVSKIIETLKVKGEYTITFPEVWVIWRINKLFDSEQVASIILKQQDTLTMNYVFFFKGIRGTARCSQIINERYLIDKLQRSFIYSS
jgi:hypothetical protein